MGRILSRRILVMSILVAAAAVGLALWFLQPQPTLLQEQASLDRALSYRSEHGRGLSPCDRFERYEVTHLARGALVRLGIPSAPLIAVVAPTFSGAKIVSFGNSSITVVSFVGDTGYTPHESWFSTPLDSIVRVPVTPLEQDTITTPLIRHTRYASTAPRDGLDGVTYFLDFGGDCAYSWSPREDEGPSALIAGILRELGNPAPSLARITMSTKELERVDHELRP